MAKSDDQRERAGSEEQSHLSRVVEFMRAKRQEQGDEKFHVTAEELSKELHLDAGDTRDALRELWKLVPLLDPEHIELPEETAPGRPSDEDNALVRAYAVRLLLTHWEREGKAHLNVAELKDALNLTEQRALSVIGDIREMADRITRPTAIDYGVPYYDQQKERNTGLKKVIAAEVAERLRAGISLACSAGTTVRHCLEAMFHTGRYMEIVTNSAAVIEEFPSGPPSPKDPLPKQRSYGLVPGIEFTGGVFHPNVRAFVGERAKQAFPPKSFTHALVGVSGIQDADGKLYVRDPDELDVVLRIVMSATQNVVIVADAHKLTKKDAWHFTSIQGLLDDPQGLKVTLVTNPVNVIEDVNERRAAKKMDSYLKQLEQNERFEVIRAAP